MAKQDFCFTYYDGDAARDMAHMNRLERGCYTDLIISQRKFGRLSIQQIKKILSKDFEECWPAIELVLLKDEDEKFHIEWLSNSIEKMKKQSKKQSGNRQKAFGSTNDQPDSDLVQPKINLVQPLGNENGDGNENVIEKGKDEGAGEGLRKVPVLLPEMFSLFKEHFPHYPEEEQDLHPLLQIAYKIGKSLNLSKHDTVGISGAIQVKKRWGELLEVMASDKWWSGKSLSKLNSEWQDFIQFANANNGNGKTIRKAGATLRTATTSGSYNGL